MFQWLSNIFAARDARKRMVVDQQDPRKGFVWGVIAVSYDVDPAYLPDHAKLAVTEWYGMENAQDIIEQTPSGFVANEHVAYNQFRLCFLARAGFGAGMLDESTSWALAIRHAAAVQQHYPTWAAYGEGYLQGHLSYRREMGDTVTQLRERESSLREQLIDKQRDVWGTIPFATRLA